jgi:hypothetical protein
MDFIGKFGGGRELFLVENGTLKNTLKSLLARLD